MVKTNKKERFSNNNKNNKNNNKRTQKRKKNIQKIVNICNDILVNKDEDCNCKDTRGLPSDNLKECAKKNNNKECNNYHLCKKFIKAFMSGSEPKYEPEVWEDPLVSDSHNCYAYFLDDRIPAVKKKCKQSKGDCSHLKPQPGNMSFLKGNRKSKNRKYTCDKMIKAVLDDNKIIELSNFEDKCKKGYYKGYLVVDKNHTYHFYRQDTNGRWSHKQGTLEVENTDASDRPIYVPHLADKNYNKENSEDGISYTDSCSYMCIPNNTYFKTSAI